MKGWWGKALFIDLGERKIKFMSIDQDVYTNFIGGRGLAIKLLWDLVPLGADPLSPKNVLIIASGPLSGMPLPSSGKLVVASKSPLTFGYGDGSLGTMASHHLRRSGFDAITITGASDKPVYLYIENDKVQIFSADDLWGKDTFETEDKLKERHGKDVGVLSIGKAGENLVRYATITSLKGRSGGRPGIGAVMGSKKLKAIVIRGTKEPEIFDEKELRRLSAEAYEKILKDSNYKFWISQGTMATIAWSHKNSVLPTMNFKEGTWDSYESISGDFMEKIKVGRRGCPYCNMQCGNIIEDNTGELSELDYENVAMLGSNLLIDDLRKVGELNRLADMFGLDTISLGNSIGFYIEAGEKRMVGEKVEWGDFKRIRELIEEVAERRGIGNFIADGVMRMSMNLGRESESFAMHVKGLEVSAYNCYSTPGMALSYGVSPIGAHHKDSFVIAQEVLRDRLSYSREKVEKVVALQNMRGGMFESLTTCRFPPYEVSLDLNYYPKMLNAATGLSITLDDFKIVTDRIYSLIRAFWIREFGYWSRELDLPPKRWTTQSMSKGPYAGVKIDIEKYDEMLSYYYELRGWNDRGIPKRETLNSLGLDFAIAPLEKIVSLK
ncbi:aldehyde ferredoxin oxidoreductase family protein [Fervidicoccus fontis]|uniref:Aldehyde ferredoxin oxidoreductase n=1 Tax=Fervidicoccus fontis TaxID=683846 RepID=A0A7C2ZQ76_9CREN|nr:aldehyde ferredoxin oxidoreductase family protein [Fervidicoccus fontis]PMB76367.1 MAG: aldehyde ferredoxin oxidoreductase [Fervidicoccus fontis]HEW63612.1 aldehyde ferredoxin oxidoreductase [Fervidicoccus fontis]